MLSFGQMLQAAAPEAFLLELLGTGPQRLTRAGRAGRLRLRAPPFTAEVYLDALAQQGLPLLAFPRIVHRHE